MRVSRALPFAHQQPPSFWNDFEGSAILDVVAGVLVFQLFAGAGQATTCQRVIAPEAFGFEGSAILDVVAGPLVFQLSAGAGQATICQRVIAP